VRFRNVRILVLIKELVKKESANALKDIQATIVLKGTFSMEKFSTEWFYVNLIGVAFYVTRETVRRIAQDMDTVMTECAIVIQIIVEIIVRSRNAHISAIHREFVKMESVSALRDSQDKTALKGLLVMEKSTNIMKFSVIRDGLALYVMLGYAN